jgi:hypothetical protein
MSFFTSLGHRLIVAAKEVQPQQRHHNAYFVVHLALPQGDYDGVEELVNQGANVNTQSLMKWETPLHKAAQ